MIGEIHKILTPYYDRTKNGMNIKSRPGLIIAKADSNDYVVLPISKVTYRENIDPEYDIQIDPIKYPDTKLTTVSYLRTHKRTVINAAEVGDKISDLAADYKELFLFAIELEEKFSKSVTEQALEFI